MEVIKSNIPDFTDTVLILGFFDGIHLGHQKVISCGVDFAKENSLKSVILTMKQSPAEYFGRTYNYIYPRKTSYKYAELLDADYLIENDFEELVSIEAQDYLDKIIEKYKPKAIVAGFNYTFGRNKEGTSELLKINSAKYGYKYFCVPKYTFGTQTVSSTKVKQFLTEGNIEKANQFLGRNFCITSSVIQGNKIARTLGFPTANLTYPKKIVKLPYGTYAVSLSGKKAVLNWGVKPTFGKNSEILEVHILDFSENLYNKTLTIEFISKIRDEKKFDNTEELKQQIQKDIQICSEL